MRPAKEGELACTPTSPIVQRVGKPTCSIIHRLLIGANFKLLVPTAFNLHETYISMFGS